MSARQPFVPGSGFGPSSRPESRAASASNASAGATSTPLHFVADPSNPLNGGSVPSNEQKERIENAENRPLNIGSLTKSNRGQNPPSRRQSIQTPARPSSDPKSMPAPNHIMRPGASDPHSKLKSSAVPNHRLQAHASSHSIVAPTPLQPRSTPALFSNSNSSSFPSAFKTPAIPGSRHSPQQHPSSESHGFRAPAKDQMTEQQQPSHEQSEEDIVSENSTFRLKTLPSQPGPHRIVFGARAVSDVGEEDEIYEIPESEVVAVRNGSGRNKRGRSEVDDDEDEHSHAHMQGYGVQAKRFKGQQVDESAYSNGSNEMYRRSSSPHDVEEYPPQQPRRRSASRSRNHPAAVHRFPPQYSTNAPSPEDSGRSSLLHLLKADDFDLASDARIEKYTRLSEKWKNCTREEWMTGADHLNGLYGKIFDFVKSHMAAKVQLFANCDEKLKQQGEVLRDRDMLLADVKDRLVADSGSVLSK